MSAKVYKVDSPLIQSKKLGYLQKRVAFLEGKSRSQEVKIDKLMAELERLKSYIGYQELDLVLEPETEFESEIEVMFPDTANTDTTDTIVNETADVKPEISFNQTHPQLKIKKVSSGDKVSNVGQKGGGSLQNYGAHTETETQTQAQTQRYKNYSKEQLLSAIAEVAGGISSARQAGRKFGVPSRTLYDKLKRLGIPNTGSYIRRESSGPGTQHQDYEGFAIIDDESGSFGDDLSSTLSISSVCSMNGSKNFPTMSNQDNNNGNMDENPDYSSSDDTDMVDIKILIPQE